MDREKSLRKLSRKDLLEIILMQNKKIDNLEIELENTKKQLNDKNILIKESGSIAEAALKLNHIFELAQKAADEYLANVKRVTKIKSKHKI